MYNLGLLSVTALAVAAAANASPMTGEVGASYRTVSYQPAPTWVADPPSASAAPTPPGSPLRVVYLDQQVRLGLHENTTYQAYRFKLLAPEALAAGNLTITWAPAADEVTVNRVAIIRDGKTTDALSNQKFVVIQREDNLEQSALTGNLTAALQVAGLQVGDELEFAVTRVSRDPLLGDQPQGLMQFPLAGIRGAYRLRVLQPKSSKIFYRSSGNLPAPVVTSSGDEADHRYVLVDPDSVVLPEGAPQRYAITRLVQYSSYPDWASLSRTFSPLFMNAAVLPPSSLVKAEANRIAATSNDPAVRAEAALRTVEDSVRYVYVGLEGGNYRPATADETWRRRYGDCKAKTVLLIALLHELGIEAEPVLVASSGGDGINERLPTPAVFDHVVVRAKVGGTAVWLDGTRMGDHKLSDLDPPRSRWGLPLRAAGAPLESIPSLPPRYPQIVQAVEIDASAGFDKPGKYHIQLTLRSDDIFAIKAQLAGLAAHDADRTLAGYWRKQFPDVEPSRTSWRFDDVNRLLILEIEGEGKVDWDGSDREGHTHYLIGGGFPPPNEMKRPKDQLQAAAWATDYPAFNCYATIVKLPVAGKGFHWYYVAAPVDQKLGGIEYWRISSFANREIRMVKSRRVDVPEISAIDAVFVNHAIPKFDNNKSYAFETSAATEESKDRPSVSPKGTYFGSFADFAGPNPPCRSRIDH